MSLSRDVLDARMTLTALRRSALRWISRSTLGLADGEGTTDARDSEGRHAVAGRLRAA